MPGQRPVIDWCACSKAPVHLRKKFAVDCAHALVQHAARIARARQQPRVQVLSIMSGNLKQDALFLQQVCLSLSTGLSKGTSTKLDLDLVMCDITYAGKDGADKVARLADALNDVAPPCITLHLTFLPSLRSVQGHVTMIMCVDPTGGIFKSQLKFVRLPGDRALWGRERQTVKGQVPAVKTKDDLFVEVLRTLRRVSTPTTTIHVLDMARTFHGDCRQALSLMEIIYLQIKGMWRVDVH